MIPILAFPVLHSSGAWIASTAASGYIAGTLSGSWVGAFILGNSGLVSSFGLVSAAGWIGATGTLSGMAASTSALAGSALSVVGLGSVAQSIGLVPATFLGLTPVGWAISATATVTFGSVGYFVISRALKVINAERQKGGLKPTTISGIRREIAEHEALSKLELLKRAAKGKANWQISMDKKNISINDEVFPLKRTRFVVNEDKSVMFVILNKMGRVIRRFRVDPRAL